MKIPVNQGSDHRTAPTVLWLLADVMHSKKISGKHLAKEMNTTESAISRLKNRRSMPTMGGEKLAGLCAVLECELGDLLKLSP